MPKVIFVKDFHWSPKLGVTQTYHAGWSGLVTTPCAKSAITSGFAQREIATKQDRSTGSFEIRSD